MQIGPNPLQQFFEDQLPGEPLALPATPLLQLGAEGQGQDAIDEVVDLQHLQIPTGLQLRSIQQGKGSAHGDQQCGLPLLGHGEHLGTLQIGGKASTGEPHAADGSGRVLQSL